MEQLKLFFRAPEALARAASRAIEAEFEADGLPVAAFEVGPQSGLWEVALYCPPGENAEIERRLRSCLPHGNIVIARETLPDTDWVSRSLQGLRPVVAGRFLVHGSHDRAAAKPWHVAIEIDAGQAFGTGHHGTTAGCLLAIDRALRRRRFARILDLGTGSGVLAIALAKALHRPVLASDIDPVAVAVARDNARRNGVAGLVEIVQATGFRHARIATGAPFDLVVANILARPLQMLAPQFARHCAPGATIFLSGLLTTQARAVIASFRAVGFSLERTLVAGEWATLTLRRPARKRGPKAPSVSSWH